MGDNLRKLFILLIVLMVAHMASATYLAEIMIKDREGDTVNVTDGAMDVHNSDVHTQMVNEIFHLHDSVSNTLASATVTYSRAITVADSTGFIAGQNIHIGEWMIVPDIIAVNGNVISINVPLDKEWPIGTDVEVVDVSLSVAGSYVSPIIFIIKPGPGEVWHITRLLGAIIDQTAMDDSKFGGITALTNGIAVIVSSNSQPRAITHWHSNQDMISDQYDLTYSDKAPAGFFGMRTRFTISNAGAVIKVDGAAGDELQLWIQDDLTGLDDFVMKAQGHVEVN